MRDSRIDKLAQVLVDYSVEVATGDLVLINGTSMASPRPITPFRREMSL